MNLFISGCTQSSLLHELSSSYGEQGLLSHCGAEVSHCSAFSCCRAQALGHAGFSSCGTWAQYKNRLNSCGARAYLLRGMWYLPRSEIKDTSPARAGGLFTSKPPGKPKHIFVCFFQWLFLLCMQLIPHMFSCPSSSLLHLTTCVPKKMK